MVEKASQGIWPSYAPIGYLNADGANGKRTIVPDPALAPLVRRLYELCAMGEHSVEELAAIAHAEHLTRGALFLNPPSARFCATGSIPGSLNGRASDTPPRSNR